MSAPPIPWTALAAINQDSVWAEPAAAGYPDRPVRLIVPFTAGGSPDTTARRVAQRLTQELGQQFVVDNKPGAAGNIGAETAAHSAPDGYTLMIMANSHVINPALYAKVNYDVIKDFDATGRGHDKIAFSSSVFDSFASVLSHASQVGQDVVIAYGADTLTLKNVKLSSLDSSDFHFA